MATPSAPAVIGEGQPRLVVPPTLARRLVGAITGDAGSSLVFHVSDGSLVVPVGLLGDRRLAIPLEQITGLRVVREMRRGLLTVETGDRGVNVVLPTRASEGEAHDFVEQVRARMDAQPAGDLATSRLDVRESEVAALTARRARAIWVVAPLLCAAYAARRALAGAVFDLDYFGASARGWIAHGEVYRLVTAAWLHANLWHLGGNLIAIVWLGRAVERALGAARLVVIMTAATLASSLASTWLTLGHTIGASGVGMGLAAAFLVLALTYRRALPRPIARPPWWWLVFGLLLLPSPEGPGPSIVDHAAHIGGACGGAIAAWLLTLRRPLDRMRTPNLAWLGALALLLHAGALGWLVLRVARTTPLDELHRLTELARAGTLPPSEANAATWRIAIRRNVEPELVRAALQLAEAAVMAGENDVGLADTVATLHHRAGSDRRAAELEARVLDRAAGGNVDATGFATQLARFLSAAPAAATGILIEASDKEVRVRFNDTAVALAESGATVYAVSLRHGRIEGLLRLQLGRGPRERYIAVPPATTSIFNALGTPIAPDAEYGTMLVRSGCGCKENSGLLEAWAIDPEVLGWP